MAFVPDFVLFVRGALYGLAGDRCNEMFGRCDPSFFNYTPAPLLSFGAGALLSLAYFHLWPDAPTLAEPIPDNGRIVAANQRHVMSKKRKHRD